MIKAILMDFNGVIIDDERIQMRAYQEVLEGKGIDLTEDDYYASLGMDDKRFVVAAYDRAVKTLAEDVCAEVIEAKNAKWHEFVGDELPLFDGIQDFIEKMAHDFTLGVVSMAPRREIEYVLQQSGLRGHFAAIVSAEDVSMCKPDPACFKIGFAKLDAVRIERGHLPMTHGECLAIEDSPPGIEAAIIADLPALGVSNTVSADRLRAAGAGAVAADLRDWMPATIRLVFP